MYKGLRIGAIIVAAGKGKRMDSDVNKQYLFVRDKPILAHTLQVFDTVEEIDDIVLVVGEDDLDYCRENIVSRYKIRKVKEYAIGGRERQHSMINGLNVLKDICQIVVTHDGARPLVSTDIIKNSIYEAYIYGAAACAVPVKDTIKLVDDGNFVVSTPDRSGLYAVQTPQTFKTDILYRAHMSAIDNDFLGTDDTMLVERMGERVKLFNGSYENIKITTPEDVYIAEAIIKCRKNKKSSLVGGLRI